MVNRYAPACYVSLWATAILIVALQGERVSHYLLALLALLLAVIVTIDYMSPRD